MFEAIRHIYTNSETTTATYWDGDVMGSVSFCNTDKAARVRSCIGPIEAVRECVASHWLGFSGKYRARTEEEVADYA